MLQQQIVRSLRQLILHLEARLESKEEQILGLQREVDRRRTATTPPRSVSPVFSEPNENKTWMNKAWDGIFQVVSAIKAWFGSFFCAPEANTRDTDHAYRSMV